MAREINGWTFKPIKAEVLCCECDRPLGNGSHIWEKQGSIAALILCNKCFDEYGEVPQSIDDQENMPGSFGNIVANAKWQL